MRELLGQVALRLRDFQDIWIFGLAIVAFYIVVLSLRRGGKKTASDPELGELLWVDEGKVTKPFFNKTFKIFGKPDAMYVQGSHVTAIEYKSRNGRIHESDVCQAMAAALAARGEGYLVRKLRIKTKTDTLDYDVPKSESEHYRVVKIFHEAALNAKKGYTSKAFPEPNKCAHCAYSSVCTSKPVTH